MTKDGAIICARSRAEDANVRFAVWAERDESGELDWQYAPESHFRGIRHQAVPGTKQIIEPRNPR